MVSSGVVVQALMIAANTSVRRPRRSRWLPRGTRETITGSASSNVRIWAGWKRWVNPSSSPPTESRRARTCFAVRHRARSLGALLVFIVVIVVVDRVARAFLRGLFVTLDSRTAGAPMVTRASAGRRCTQNNNSLAPFFALDAVLGPITEKTHERKAEHRRIQRTCARAP